MSVFDLMIKNYTNEELKALQRAINKELEQREKIKIQQNNKILKTYKIEVTIIEAITRETYVTTVNKKAYSNEEAIRLVEKDFDGENVISIVILEEKELKEQE